MKIKFITTPILIVIYQFSVAQYKIDKEHFIDLLTQQNYNKAYLELVAIQTQPFGKCCLTDYLIGKTLCLSGLPKAAKGRYENILKDYKQLPAGIKKFIEEEENNCDPHIGVLTEPTRSNIKVFPNIAPAGVMGKLGIVYNCFQSYQSVQVIREIPNEEFNSRIFSIDQKDDAVKKIQTLIPVGYSVFAKDNFILVMATGPDTTKIKREEVIDELVKTFHFYASYYGLRLPDKLITAYIVPDNRSLQIIANAVHGIRVPVENYGYSLLNDLSILGISNFIGTGTLKHELFHIIVRADIGDIPAWLDEGIATVYEESHWSNNNSLLIPDNQFWRMEVLKKSLTGFHLYSKLPDLKTLIDYSWTEFDGTDKGDICKAAVNYAFAKHFVLYLAKTNQLKTVLDAFKNKRGSNRENSIKSNSEILEEACGVKSDSIERAFNTWLIKNYALSFIDPLTNRMVDWGNNEGISAIMKFKRNISQAKNIYDSLLNDNSPLADSLLSHLDKSKSLFEDCSNKFENDMRQLYNQKDGHINDINLAEASFEFINSIRQIDMDLEIELSKYKK